MKIRTAFALFLLACAAPLATLFADSVTLNSGEKIEGKIIKQTDTDVTIEVKVSATINDERTVPRADIKSVETATEDDIAFDGLKAVQVNPEYSLTPEAYEAVIGKLKEFTEKYPLSPHVAAVKETASAFEAEQKRVAGGEIKILGKWLTKDEAEKRKYQIQAQVLFATMRDAKGRGDYIGALNTFDALERSYLGARVYPDAAVLARQVLGSLAGQVANSEQMLVMQKQQLDQVLAATPEPKKSELVHSMASQTAGDDAAFDAAKGKWKILIPRNAKSVAAIKQMIPTENTRLAALPVQNMKLSLAAADAAKQALDVKNFADAQQSLQKATSLWGQNEETTYLTKTLTEAKQAAVVKTAAAKPSDKARAELLAAQAEAARKAAAEADRPFYMTLKGALMILGGVLVLVIIGTVVSKLTQSRAKDGGEK